MHALIGLDLDHLLALHSRVAWQVRPQNLWNRLEQAASEEEAERQQVVDLQQADTFVVPSPGQSEVAGWKNGDDAGPGWYWNRGYTRQEWQDWYASRGTAAGEHDWHKTPWAQHLLRPGTMDQLQANSGNIQQGKGGATPQEGTQEVDGPADAAAAAEAAAKAAAKEVARKKAHAKYMKFYRSLESLGPSTTPATLPICAQLA